ncbi:hypothetical protein [Ferrovibrio terrae]|uniref:hypothetical protein n=1 Tax=Ferrovibrio terrae TaxID=2594003 RepID=UPI003137BFB7
MACDDYLLPPAILAEKRRAARSLSWSALLSLLRCWCARAKERQELARMGNLAWRDLGLSDVDRQREVNKSFWQR